MTDSILIVGGGIAGLHAALECAAGGAAAIVVERNPVVGGRLAAAMGDATAIGDRSEGVAIPLFTALDESDQIEVLTNATVEMISGVPGNFSVSVRQRARFVTDECTRCKLCHAVCPVVRGNDYDAGLTFRKAIYTPMSKTYPDAWVIDIEDCLNTPPNLLPCDRCIEVCDDDAIRFDLPLDSIHEYKVGAVILAPGLQTEDSKNYIELGYGAHPDVVTSSELQRLLESPGPTGGYATRPSNEEYPESVLLVLDKLSPFALYIVASQVRQLLEQDILDVSVLVLAAPGSETVHAQAQEFAEAAGVKLHWGTMFEADTTSDSMVNVSFEDLSANRLVQASYEMVVLCTDVEPPDGLAELAEVTGVTLADDGYLAIMDSDDSGVSTARPGVFVAGCAGGAKNIKESIGEARVAAAAALAQLNPRLLKGDHAAVPVEPQSTEDSGPTATPGLQGQIEALLFALLEGAHKQD